MTPALLALALALAAPGATPPPASPTPPRETARYAVVIGHNGAGDDAKRTPLVYADDDAARLYLQLLPSLSRGWLLTTLDDASARAFPDLTSTAREPSRRELARVLGELAWEVRENERRGQKSELMFYFAGHGDVGPGGEGFLIFSDGAFTRSDLETQVVGGAGAALQHIVIDACASYFMVARGGTESGERRLTPQMLDALSGKSTASARTGVLVSTSGAAEVHESNAIGGGVFSYLLRSALAGAADSDGDGRVEYAEAAAFIESASSQVVDPRARLAVHAAAPAQDPHATLADMRTSGAKHFLHVDTPRARHVRVLDAHGVPLVEAHRRGSAPIVLALVGNPFYIVQVDDEEAVLVPRSAGAYALSALRFAPGERRRARGHEVAAALFSTPFEAAFVAGYAARTGLVPPRAGDPLQVAWAPGHEPATRFPFVVVGGATLALSGLLAVAAVTATVANAFAFAELSTTFERTRAIDPEKAIEVEAWRTTAAATTVGAVVFALAGGGIVAWDLATNQDGAE